jgi:multiple sugar transport system permease protein
MKRMLKTDTQDRFKWNIFTRQRVWGFSFVLPAVLFFAIFAFYPMINAFYISLTEYDLITPPRFIGLGNYLRMFHDSRFEVVVQNTLLFAFGSSIPTWLLSLALAMALVKKFPGKEMTRTAYFLPVIVSAVVVSMVWRMLYHPLGPINALLEPIFHRNLNWITDKNLVDWAIIITNVWQSVGFYMVIYIAGLQNIPDDFYDSAKVDGASSTQSFWYITLPLLKPTTLLVLVIMVINGFQSFTYQYVLTKGGPGDASNVIALYIYYNAFQYQYMGYASAISIVMFVVIMILTLIQFRIVRSEDVSYV